MASERLQVILELVSGQYKREAKAAASATGQIADSADKAGTATGKIGQGFNKLGGVIKGFVGAGLALSAGAQVKRFVDESIDAFSELEQSTGAVEAIFGKTSKTIDAWAQGAARAFGLSENQAKQSASVIGAFLQNYGFAVDEAAAKSMELTELGADLAAMFGGTVPDAVGAISAALRGEFNPIERYGVSLRVATIEAHALEMGLAKTKAELDQNSKMLATLDLLTKQTAKAQGQFARELDTVAGREAVLNAERENSQALLGEALVGVRNVTQSMQSGLNKALTDVALSFGHLSGEIDKGRASLIAFENETGRSATSVEDAVEGVTIKWQDWTYELKVWQDNLFGGNNKTNDLTAAIRQLWQESDQSADTFTKFNAQLVTLFHTGEISEEQFLAMKAALKEEEQAARIATQTHNEAEHARWRVVDATEAAGEAAEDTAEKTEAEARTVRDLRNAYLEAADPIFAAVSAVDRYRQAQENLEEVQKDRKSTDQDVAAAQLDVAQSALDAQVALDKLGDGGLTQGIDAIATALGVSRNEARDLLEVLGVLDGKKVTTVVETRFTQTGNKVGGASFTPELRHSGGQVEKNTPYLVGKHGAEELFIPDTAGTILSHQRTMGAFSGGTPVSGGAGSTTQVHIHGDLYGFDDFVRKVHAAGVDIRRLGLS